MTRRIALTLLITVLLLVLSTALLLGTAAGNRFLLARASGALPGELTVEQWQGSLLGEVTATGLRYQQGDLAIMLDQVSLHLRPRQLWRGWLHLDYLRLGTLSVTLPAKPPDAEPRPFALPEQLTLPFGVRIEQAQAKALYIADLPPITQVQGEQWAAWRRLTLPKVHLQLAGFTLRSDLQGKLSAPYPLTGNLLWQQDSPDEQAAANAAGELALSGTLPELIVQHRLQRPLSLDSRGQLRLHDGKWMLDMAHQWQPQTVTTPLAQQVRLGAGSLTTKGPLDTLTLEGQSPITLGENRLQASLQGQFSDKVLTLRPLTLTQKERRLVARGTLALAQPLRWDLDLSGSLDPQWLHPAYPGRLALSGTSRGQWQGQQWQLAATRVTLSGTVRQHPLKWQATASGDSHKLTLRSHASWHDNEIKVQGELTQNWNMRSEFALNTLSLLAPDAQGQLFGQVALTGPRRSPVVSGSLSGKQLGWQQWLLAEAQAEFDQLGPASPGMSLTLDAAEFKRGAKPLWSTLSVKAAGKLPEHTLRVSGEHQQFSVQTRLAGSYQQQQWQGTIRDSLVHHRQLGRWQQDAASRLTLSRRQQQLAPLCLERNGSKLCLNGDLDPATLTAGATLQRLPLKLVNTFLPAQTALQGKLSAELSVEGARDNPSGTLTAHTEAASISLLEGAEASVIHIEQSRLAAELHQGIIDSTLVVQSSDGTVEATARHGLTPESPLSGHIQLDWQDLNRLALLTTQVQEVKGQITGKVSLAGTLARPQVDGELTLRNGRGSLPSLGIAVTDANLAVTGRHGGDIRVEGQAYFGAEPLKITGSFNPQATIWEGKLRLTGKNLAVAHRPDAKVWMSPDLTLTQKGRRLALRGEVRIPRATLEPKKLPEGAVTVSKDQVIITHEQETTQPLALDTRVTLKLGDQVHFKGLGLNARLGGDVLVIQPPNRPVQLNGELVIVEGRYRAYGQNLAIENGMLIFNGPPDNPGLNIRAIRKIPSDDVVVGTLLTGTLQEPDASIFSEPAMEQSQAMAYLLTGRPLERGSDSDNAALAQALALYGLQKGSGVTEKVGEKLGLDEIRIGSEWETSDAALMLGKQISERLYLTYAIGLFDAVSTVMLRYTLTRQLYLEGQSSTEANSIDLIWEKDFK